MCCDKVLPVGTGKGLDARTVHGEFLHSVAAPQPQPRGVGAPVLEGPFHHSPVDAGVGLEEALAANHDGPKPVGRGTEGWR